MAEPNAQVDDVMRFEMFFCRSTNTAFFKGVVPWLADFTWHCPGIDPSLFGGGAVPIKQYSPDHRIASKYFAMAHRARHVTGLPNYLLVGSMDSNWAVHHFVCGDIVSHPDQHAIGFVKLLSNENYPGLKWTDYIEFEGHVAAEILQGGYLLLETPADSAADGASSVH